MRAPGGLRTDRVYGEKALREAWSVLGWAYDPPLWERIGDYDSYVSKVALHAITLLARDGARLLGGISFYANDTAAGEAFITQVMVAPEAQGMGVGTHLLAECERFARGVGMSSIVLEVRTDNAGARHLYERVGYEAFGKTVTGSLMRKYLDEPGA